MNHRVDTAHGREVVKSYCKISVDQRGGEWCATLIGTPGLSGLGELPTEAIRRLVETQPNFEIDQIIPLEDATRDDHLEFIVTLNERRADSAAVRELSIS